MTARTCAALLRPGRGLIAMDQPREHVDAMLLRAKVPVTDANRDGLRALVLSTPGLDRVVGGVLLAPGSLDHGVPRSVPVGVRMDHFGDGGADTVARHRAAGARFARWRLIVGAGEGVAREAARARQAARWAAACQRGGLVPFVECVVRVPARTRIDEAERFHTSALGSLLTMVQAAGADLATTVLGTGFVVPGHRCSQAADSTDVARATARSLRAAGACSVAGVVFSPPADPRHLTAHLTALQWLRPGWAPGYCLGRSLLTPVAVAWRGRVDRQVGAQRELLSRLSSMAGVLQAGPDAERRAG